MNTTEKRAFRVVPKIILLWLLTGMCFGQNQNRLFWDGGDWKTIEKMVNYDLDTAYKIKSAYINGVLDGRLFFYLKTWHEQAAFADSLYGETVDYLSTHELVRNLDNFYTDPIYTYIPIPSAIIIMNMYGERIPPEIIDVYIDQTRLWINNLMLRIEDEGYDQLLEDKLKKHLEK